MTWWGSKGDQKPKEDVKDQSHPAQRDATTQKLAPLEKSLKPEQKIIGTEGKTATYEDIREGHTPDSTESNVRYVAYANRIRTILSSAHRYVAYTSDIGESFRPVAHPNIVRTAYGISWLYILGDVSYEGYKAYLYNQRIKNPYLQLTPRQEKMAGLKSHEPPTSDTTSLQPRAVTPLEDYRTVMVQRAIFQSIASMGLPAFTIHSVVKYSGKALKDAKNQKIRTWGPIGLGLAVVPFLPTFFDEPVEHAVEWAFHKGFEAYGGKQYVGHATATEGKNPQSKPKTD